MTAACALEAGRVTAGFTVGLVTGDGDELRTRLAPARFKSAAVRRNVTMLQRVG